MSNASRQSVQPLDFPRATGSSSRGRRGGPGWLDHPQALVRPAVFDTVESRSGQSYRDAADHDNSSVNAGYSNVSAMSPDALANAPLSALEGALNIVNRNQTRDVEGRPPAESAREERVPSQAPPSPETDASVLEMDPSEAEALSTPNTPSMSVPSELALELEARSEAFAEAAGALGAERHRVAKSMEEPLLDLAFALAAELVGEHLSANPDAYRHVIQQALGALGHVPQACLRASEDAYETIVDVFEGKEFECEGVRVRVERDASLEGLGCELESVDRIVDASIESRLADARRAIRSLRSADAVDADTRSSDEA